MGRRRGPGHKEGQTFIASPAIIDGEIYLRGQNTLFDPVANDEGSKLWLGSGLAQGEAVLLLLLRPNASQA